MNWCQYAYWYKETNTHKATSWFDALGSQATSGIDETWNPAYTHSDVTGNKVKATNPDFLACKAAADYDPGVPYTGSPALQWYLPSASDYKWLLSQGFGDKTAITIGWQTRWYGKLVNFAFEQVGGEFSGYNWTSSASDNLFIFFEPNMTGVTWGRFNKNILISVRAFVKY